MLLCFGAAWPFFIHKSIKTQRVSGKSPIFLIIVLIGYIAGIIHKILYNYDFVLFLYFINTIMVMVGIDTLLYFRLRSSES